MQPVTTPIASGLNNDSTDLKRENFISSAGIYIVWQNLTVRNDYVYILGLSRLHKSLPNRLAPMNISLKLGIKRLVI